MRAVIVASLMCSPVAHAFIRTGDALSTLCMKLKSLKLALPAPPPPPPAIVPVCDTPQDHDEHFDLVLVLAVERFALDVANLRENV